MQSTATICLLVMMMFVQTPAGQLLKIPAFIEHFAKHQKHDGSSLVHFLKDHYASNHSDADLPEDEQLPFKTVTFYAIGNATVPDVIKTDAFLPSPSGNKIFFLNTYVPQQHLGSIFHPPRM